MSRARPSTVLSVVIPIYNELDTWRELVRRVTQAPLGDIGLQVILIDDASTDGSREQIQSFERELSSARDAGILPACFADVPSACVEGVSPSSSLFPAVSSSVRQQQQKQQQRQQQDAGKMPATHADRMSASHEGKMPSPWIEYVVLYHSVNRGKGGALRTGFAAASGDFVIVQDADLEYDPAQYPQVLAPLLEGRAKVVYGSRFSDGRPRHSALMNYLANRLLTALSNWTTGLRLTDMETCYKAFRLEVIQSVSIEQERFGFEPEITAKVAAMGLDVVDVPINYVGRTKAQGKKIGFADGLETLGCIWKYRPRKTVERRA